MSTGWIEPATGRKSAKVFQCLANAFQQRRLWHGTKLALESTVIQIIGDRDLSLAKRDKPRRSRLHRAQGLMKRRQIDDLAAEIVGLGSLVRRHQTTEKCLGHVIGVLQVLRAAVGNVIGTAKGQGLDRLGRPYHITYGGTQDAARR